MYVGFYSFLLMSVGLSLVFMNVLGRFPSVYNIGKVSFYKPGTTSFRIKYHFSKNIKSKFQNAY